MKPNELRAFRRLSRIIKAYRAHRPNETDWISYTTCRQSAKQFALARSVEGYAEYEIERQDVLAYFLRRGESELIVLSPVLVKRTGYRLL